MKRTVLGTTILGISFLLPFPAIAAAFSSIYSFGDSLTDTGNVSTVTGGLLPPGPIIGGEYFEGRFSNGKIWIDYLQDKLGIPVVNSAFGGATTGLDNTLNDPAFGLAGLPGLQQQILNFTTLNPVADPTALYTVWAGANDYLPTQNPVFVPYNTPNIPLSNLEFALANLVGIGAKNIMVFNLPDLGKLPLTRGLNADGICPPNINAINDADCLNELTLAHNTGLSNLLSSLPPEVQVFQVDVNSLFNRILANPIQFGFTNVTDSCYIFPNNSCSNPDEYFFWDRQHPTTEGHRLVGNLAFNSLGIPEPSTIAGLATVGIIGISRAFKKSKN